MFHRIKIIIRKKNNTSKKHYKNRKNIYNKKKNLIIYYINCPYSFWYCYQEKNSIKTQLKLFVKDLLFFILLSLVLSLYI